MSDIKIFELNKEQRQLLGSLIAHTVGDSALTELFGELYDEFNGEWQDVAVYKRNFGGFPDNHLIPLGILGQNVTPLVLRADDNEDTDLVLSFDNEAHV
jgi:sigma54-dependent transcription regulator